jgi:hypothetical protein
VMTCSRDGVAGCGMAGRVQNAGRSHLTGVGCLPFAPHTERGAQLHLRSSRQMKGGASRSQDARTAGLQPAEEEACTPLYLLKYRTWDDTWLPPHLRYGLHVSPCIWCIQVRTALQIARHDLTYPGQATASSSSGGLD